MTNKTIETSSLVLEIENGTNEKGEKVYKKKTFSNVRTDADVDAILGIGKAIAAVLAVETRTIFLNDSSILSEA